MGGSVADGNPVVAVPNRLTLPQKLQGGGRLLSCCERLESQGMQHGTGMRNGYGARHGTGDPGISAPYR